MRWRRRILWRARTDETAACRIVSGPRVGDRSLATAQAFKTAPVAGQATFGAKLPQDQRPAEKLYQDENKPESDRP
jgi:hypothetical protein